ncbi:gamma-glutamylcyclotransferase [Tamlana agarivorans]|uniref:Gamma-glutamylcyclotransferase n=1 Tax=Pseudotamlana agarivorans TaxID=481183 RepID=A0ACC5UCP5_9FLAO|nr:gamma-glutamylcyclotransferase family protein [Tamlana agarivorans]MBU2952029.1 gamma-glutamylcyclotransferase [Tamlana agarivorans]
MKSDYIFVYGTLLKDAEHSMSKFLEKHSAHEADGCFYGKLYLVSWFPGAIPSKNPSEKVYGSLFRVFDFETVFKALDVYEGVNPQSLEPDLFQRHIVSIYLEDHSVIEAWVYFFNHPVEGLKQITSGDFLNYSEK